MARRPPKKFFRAMPCFSSEARGQRSPVPVGKPGEPTNHSTPSSLRNSGGRAGYFASTPILPANSGDGISVVRWEPITTDAYPQAASVMPRKGELDGPRVRKFRRIRTHGNQGRAGGKVNGSDGPRRARGLGSRKGGSREWFASRRLVARTAPGHFHHLPTTRIRKVPAPLPRSQPVVAVFTCFASTFPARRVFAARISNIRRPAKKAEQKYGDAVIPTFGSVRWCVLLKSDFSKFSWGEPARDD